MKQDNYYNLLRTDILEIIPPNISSLLSVGCATGRTEFELIKRGIDVFGIEYNLEAAKVARQRGITIIEGDASSVDVGFFQRDFDFIVYADILEHLYDPVSVLRRHIFYLKPGGKIYISVPNFRHYSVLWELFVRGRIDYTDAGILDKTHIRMTTRKMVLAWLNEVGLSNVNLNYIIHSRRYRFLSACLWGLAREFIASQIGVVADKKY